jgi:hypothetical protein
MSKKTLGTILSVASIALMFVPIPGLGQLAAFGLKIAVSSLLAVGLGVASSLLLKASGPKAPAHAQDRLQASYDIHAPRKIVFGHTAAGTDVRYQAYTGSNQEYLDQIVVVASHECEAVEEIWFDSKKAWSASGGITSDFTGYLTIDVRNPGTRVNGIAIDSTWTANCSLTGCTYFHARYKLTGNSSKAQSPFASSIPSRMTVRVKGAKVPDLRVGGVDPANQATWVYSSGGSDSGRNPAWARLFYEIGWRINGKLALGQGKPIARLNLPSYTTAANHCDESVALAAGGTEPRYRHDMVYSESEDPSSVLMNISAAMNAVPTDDGGKISILCLHDDLSDPDVLELSDDDLADPAEENWDPEAEIQSTVNIVRGAYTDPSDTSLYQLAPETEVALDDAAHDYGSLDGVQRIAPFSAPQVQSPTQWQRLATLRLMRSQYAGVYKANFKARGWLGRMFGPVSFTHRGLGFVAKNFQVIGIGLPTGSIVPLTLREVDHAGFGWSTGDEQAVGTATAPANWNWANDPLLQGVADLANAATVVLYQSNNTGIAPAVPGSTLTFTFATEALSGTLGSWSQSVPPPSSGAFRFSIQAVASGPGATDTIATGEWSTPNMVASDGAGFIQPAAPTAQESVPATHWLDSDDGYRTYVRVAGSGMLQLNGADVLLNGVPVELAWSLSVDLTLAAQVTVQAPLNPTIQRDSAGVVVSGQLPRTLGAPGLTRNGASITTSDSVSYAIQNIAGGIGAVTIDTANGSSTKGQSTIPTGLTSGGSYEIVATVDGVAQQPIKISVSVQNATPTQSSSKSGSTDVADDVTTTSYVQIGSIIAGLVKATGETIRGYYFGTYLKGTGSAGSRTGIVKWQYSPTGAGSWTDLASGVTGSASTRSGEGGVDPGEVTCNQTVAPANGTYDLRLVGAMTVSGSDIIFQGETATVLVGT